MNKKSKLMIPDEIVMNKIYIMRDLRIMVDRDLAELYGVETKRLKEAVRRNMQRFPSDFMFEMNDEEFRNWRTQFASSNSDVMGLRHHPFCFTEQGVTMLSCILNSERAIAVNIQIIRIFTKMRELLLTNKEVLLQLEMLEKQVLKNKIDIQSIFSALRQLINPGPKPRKQMGFKPEETNL
jgi:hypothetical protein